MQLLHDSSKCVQFCNWRLFSASKLDRAGTPQGNYDYSSWHKFQAYIAFGTCNLSPDAAGKFDRAVYSGKLRISTTAQMSISQSLWHQFGLLPGNE